MSSSSSLQQPQSASLVGAWFCQISSRLREARRRGARAELDDEQSTKNAIAERNKAPREEAKTSSTVTSSCRGRAGAAMPEATVCLLLDRFAPS